MGAVCGPLGTNCLTTRASTLVSHTEPQTKGSKPYGKGWAESDGGGDGEHSHSSEWGSGKENSQQDNEDTPHGWSSFLLLHQTQAARLAARPASERKLIGVRGSAVASEIASLALNLLAEDPRWMQKIEARVHRLDEMVMWYLPERSDTKEDGQSSPSRKLIIAELTSVGCSC
jgi:hypothetical protein